MFESLVWANLTGVTLVVLLVVLAAEAANGFTDAPAGTSAAVAANVLTSKQALVLTAAGNGVGLLVALYVGAAVAKTIGTGIVNPSIVTVASIGVAMITSFLWSLIALWLALPISKTHSLLAALAGIGYTQGGWQGLLPASGNWSDSGWIAVGIGVFTAIMLGASLSWLIASIIIKLKLSECVPETWWRRIQLLTVSIVSTGHGFNDGLKYVGVFSLVLYKSGATAQFIVFPEVIVLCAVIMAAGTMLGGWPIHRRLNDLVNGDSSGDGATRTKTHKKFRPYMGVVAESSAALLIWWTGMFGTPMSTNHGIVSAMAGAKSADGKVHLSSLTRIIWGWIVTYLFCFIGSSLLTRLVV